MHGGDETTGRSPSHKTKKKQHQLNNLPLSANRAGGNSSAQYLAARIARDGFGHKKQCLPFSVNEFLVYVFGAALLMIAERMRVQSFHMRAFRNFQRCAFTAVEFPFVEPEMLFLLEARCSRYSESTCGAGF